MSSFCNVFVFNTIAIIFFFLHHLQELSSESLGFVRTSGTQFAVDDHTLYVNGFNAYYLTAIASNSITKPSVTQLLREAASAGLTVGRTWAFNDGGYHAIQVLPGVFDPNAFQALDFVLHEAHSNGLRLILSLCNNYADMGGKAQYVQWARNAGLDLPSDDAFFYNPTVKTYFKNYIKTVLTRVNSFTGIAYKDDPTIFAWELMNEARCEEDASGNILQAWIEEMASYLKSIDSNHLLEIGLEGFYGATTPSRQSANPGAFAAQMGTDFIRNNQAYGIDFTTVHSYPDQWIPEASFEDQLFFLANWVNSHMQDGSVLGKPVLLAEFGMTSKGSSFSLNKKYTLFSTIYNFTYSSASKGGPAAGALFWQLLPESLLPNLGDGYEIVLSQESWTASLIASQSQRLSQLNHLLWK